MPNLAYDPSTVLGQTRLWASDTVIDSAVFDDPELIYFLSVGQNNPMLAAAYALQTASVDEAKQSKMVKFGPLTTDSGDLAQQLADRAANLFARAGGIGSITDWLPDGSHPDKVFSTDSLGGEIQGTTDGW